MRRSRTPRQDMIVVVSCLVIAAGIGAGVDELIRPWSPPASCLPARHLNVLASDDPVGDDVQDPAMLDATDPDRPVIDPLDPDRPYTGGQGDEPEILS